MCERPIAFAVVYSVLVVASMLGVGASSSPAEEPEPIETTLRLEKSEVSVDQVIRLQELIPRAKTIKVVGISHKVWRIGRYDEKSGALVNFPVGSYSPFFSADQFAEGLPTALRIPHGLTDGLFDVQDPRRKGVEFECRPKRVGIFLITASWQLRDRGDWIASAPIVVTVKPPVDKKGKPIVKPEWLKEDWNELDETSKKK